MTDGPVSRPGSVTVIEKIKLLDAFPSAFPLVFTVVFPLLRAGLAHLLVYIHFRQDFYEDLPDKRSDGIDRQWSNEKPCERQSGGRQVIMHALANCPDSFPAGERGQLLDSVFDYGFVELSDQPLIRAKHDRCG